jgi:hypothetical protein
MRYLSFRREREREREGERERERERVVVVGYVGRIHKCVHSLGDFYPRTQSSLNDIKVDGDKLRE